MKINYYGLFHAIGIILIHYIFKSFFIDKFNNLSMKDFEVILSGGIISVILGGRIMCILQNDIEIRDFHKIYEGGLSAFGDYYFGLLYLFIISSIYKLDFVLMVECCLLSTGHQVVLGRLGNFVKGELRGKYSPVLGCRHPSQIYQLLSEGILTHGILWLFYHQVGQGIIFVLMPIIYGLSRFICEFFKEEDRGMPQWFALYFHKYLRFAQFQAILLPIIFISIYTIANVSVL